MRPKPWLQMPSTIAKLVISLAFTSLGLLAVFRDGRSQFTWTIPTTLFFSICTVFYLIQLTNKRKPKGLSASPSATVIFDNEHITCIRTSGLEESVLWCNLEEVFIFAEDAFPIGNIYWGLRGAGKSGCAIPWDALNAKELLSAMQDRLTGFDNSAVIAASGMLDGAVRVWHKDNNTSIEFVPTNPPKPSDTSQA